MRTAIYIPDDVFSMVERVAQRLKISRSELFRRAVQEYIDDLASNDITEKLNTVYEEEDSGINEGLCRAQRNALEYEE